MPVRLFRTSDLPGLHAIYDKMRAPVTHGFPVTLEEFEASFAEAPAYLRRPVTLVSERNGRLTGFIRFGIYNKMADRWSLANDGNGLILGPFIYPDQTSEGAELISAALMAARSAGIHRLCAFDPCEAVGMPTYNGGWCGLSEQLPFIITLLTTAGFRIRHRELLMTRNAYPVVVSTPFLSPYTLSCTEQDRNRFRIDLLKENDPVAMVRYSRMLPARSSHSEAGGIGYIDGLSVQPEYQGHSYGRKLLLLALSTLREIGCGPVCLTTGGTNHRAQNLYYSEGFQMVDSCLSFIKENGSN